MKACQLLLLSLFSIALRTSAQHIGEKQFVTSADGIRIACEVKGSGSQAVVFIHGWSCDRGYWADQADAFAKEFKVVLIDLPGHGDSGLGRKDYTMEAFGSDVALVARSLDLQNVILVGHSMGGDVIAAAALQMRDRMKGMVMVDAYKSIGAGRTDEQVQNFIASLLPDFKSKAYALVRTFFVPGTDEELVHRVATDMSSAPVEIALSEVKWALSYSREISAAMKRLKLPTVTINPDDSPTDMVSMKEHGINVLILPKTGHFLMMENPAKFNELLEKAIFIINAK
jgi:pimeloyl-ACP methyl ester carboxylesterase